MQNKKELRFKTFKELDGWKIGEKEYNAVQKLLKNQDFKIFREWIETKILKMSSDYALGYSDDCEEARGAGMFWRQIMSVAEGLEKNEDNKTD